MKALTFAHRLALLSFSVSLVAAGAAPASAPAGGAAAPTGSVKLTLAAYSTPAEAYAKIIPLFQADYKAKTGQDVGLATSYQGSGPQARAVVGGLEADVVALS